jgi:hypothetical protein
VYIEDKILIEDAAATIDVINRGWRVYHDLRRLSYSATPPDFGALLIQRRRWANGGLLILPRLLRDLFRRPWSIKRFAAGVVRVPILVEHAIAGVGLPILLLYRFDDGLMSPWMTIAAIPYYVLFGCDLHLAGYRWKDLVRVYTLNLLLIPVNFAGTAQSLRQALSGHPVPFKRTPKRAGRTSIPIAYLAAIYGFCIYNVCNAIWDASDSNFRHMLFAALNGTAAAYGIYMFIGLKTTCDDLVASAGASTTLHKLATWIHNLGRPVTSHSLAPRQDVAPSGENGMQADPT